MSRPGTDRSRPRARTKTWAPDIEAAGRSAGLLFPEGLTDSAEHLRRLLAQWIAAEVAPGRLVTWLPVAFALGIVAYFTAAREPAWWAATGLTLACVVVTILVRRRSFGFPLAVGSAAIAAGFAVATVQTLRIDHPILEHAISSVVLAGFVEIREERERSDRIVLRVERFDAPSAKIML